MSYQYAINAGEVQKINEEYLFKGKKIVYSDPISKEPVSMPLYSAILFPFNLQNGTMSCDVEFSNICNITRCGFIFNHLLIDGISKYYQVGIRNNNAFCSLDFYNGKSWDFLALTGSDNNLNINFTYKLKLKIKGNILSFFVNDVPMFYYSKLENSQGICGIYTFNEYDSTIKNVHIDVEKPTAFSIMKFEKDFDSLYQDVIAPICEECGYKSIRADECYTSSFIIQDIIREISNASLIIADITMDNPNVFYELGYAHALNKPTILLADIAKRDDLPFDISGYRTIFYSNSIRGKKEIEETLRKYIENSSNM